MNETQVRRLVLACVALFPFLVLAANGRAARIDAAHDANRAACSAARQSNAPQASISNGLIDGVVFLPDAKNGYYRGARFDWSGVVGCLAYKGHTYFGVWFPHYDPLLHDAITGPVEEFRPRDAAPLGYDAASPGETFVKVGVGVLRRTDAGPFKFTDPYPLIDGGKRTVRTRHDGVSFTQDLTGPSGISYVYKKELRLDKHQPVLLLKHELKNTGTTAIETDVYNHDFFVLDGAPTGPGMVVRFSFEPRADPALSEGGRIEGSQIVYDRELQKGESVNGSLTGFSSNVSDYHFFVENQKTGVGVEQSGDLPISSLYFWSIRTTICPEAYLHLKVAPGKTIRWTTRYRFYAK